jgi:excinuclease ABC subunit C
LTEANDFLSMQEVMSRRYSPERMADERFGSRPDLIVLDGGRPQLNAALEMFEQMGVDIPIVGLAKRDEEVFVPWDLEGPVVLPGGSASLYLIKQVRDEAHRFAITFHRELRGKGMTASILDTVPGIGPVRKKALLKHFKSMRALREATLEQIQDAHILPKEVATDLYAVLAQYKDNNQNKSQEEAIISHADNPSATAEEKELEEGEEPLPSSNKYGVSMDGDVL